MSNQREYFGGFFWVAVVSFIVPFFVGWKAFDKLHAPTKPTPQVDASGVDHAVWDYLLKTYVSNGLVDYDGMKKDYLFREYLRELGQCNPDALKTDDEKLALLCNAYNAFVINGVISHKVTDTVNSVTVDEKPFFKIKEHIFAGETYTLDYLEKDMNLKVFGDPRVHVAVVCAARSCPGLRSEAYVGNRIQNQLEDQSRQFANNPKYVMYDKESGELKVNRILEWYPQDFDQRYSNGGYLQWINEMTDDPVIKEMTEKAINGDVQVSYFDYDWTLNSQAEPGESAAASKHFGSGAIPDE